MSMRSFRKELWFEVASRRGFINITSDVERCLGESGIQEGLCLVNAMHITASVFVNDDESGLHHDYEKWLERLAPHEPVSQYDHNRTGEDNGDAPSKTSSVENELRRKRAPSKTSSVENELRRKRAASKTSSVENELSILAVGWA